MKGKLVKQKDNWYVMRIEEGDWKTYYLLHPDDIKIIQEESLIFDNIEARIAAYPDVEFEIVDVWENKGIGTNVIRHAKLKQKYESNI